MVQARTGLERGVHPASVSQFSLALKRVEARAPERARKS